LLDLRPHNKKVNYCDKCRDDKIGHDAFLF
jgi:hypothetical protein